MQKYQRSFAIWLFVVGIVGVHSRFVPNDISVDDQVLDGINYDKPSSLYSVELDSSFPDTEAVPENEHVEKTVRKRSNPQGGRKMSDEDFAWHAKEGEKVMYREWKITEREKLEREKNEQRGQQRKNDAGTSRSQNARQDPRSGNQARPSKS